MKIALLSLLVAFCSTTFAEPIYLDVKEASTSYFHRIGTQEAPTRFVSADGSCAASIYETADEGSLVFKVENLSRKIEVPFAKLIKNDAWDASDDRNPNIEEYTEFTYSSQALTLKSGVRAFPTQSDRDMERERGPQDLSIESKNVILEWMTGGFRIVIQDSENSPTEMSCVVQPSN